jgi:hypothetical protein
MSFQRSFTSTNGLWLSPNASILTGKWYHMVVAYDSSSAVNSPILYINGIPAVMSVSSTPVGTAVSDINDNLLIGNNAAQNRGFDGHLGLIRIYNRIIPPIEAASLFKVNAWRYGLPA